MYAPRRLIGAGLGGLALGGLLPACTRDLLPDEYVLPGEWPVETRVGPPGAELGSVVAWSGELWAATAPGTGTVALGEGTLPIAATWVGFSDGHLVHADEAGTAWVDGEERWRVEGAVAWAAGDAGVVAATAGGVEFLVAGRRVQTPGVTALAVGTDRVLGVVCEDACVARAWSPGGEPLGLEMDAGEGGTVGEWEGVAWAGDPMLDDPDGAGRLVAEDGRTVEGLAGDHLGRAVGGGYVVGTFNKWVVPARARLVPLEGDGVLAFEEGAEDQPLTLAGADGTLVVGVPYWAEHGVPSGAVFTLSVP